MNEIFEIVFNLSLLSFIVGSMVVLGLNLTIAQIITPFKQVKIVIMAIITNFVIIPLFAFGLVSVLAVPEGVKIGIILLSLSGGAPFIPMIVAVAKGHVASSVGLMILLLLISIFFIPIAVPIVLAGTEVSSWELIKSLVSMMLLPLVLALFIRARYPVFAATIQAYIAKLTNISVLLMVVAVLFLYTETIISNANTLPIISLFFIGAMLIGYVSGGRNRHARIILAIGTGLRNPPIAILVAHQSFQAEPMAALVPLEAAIIGLSILLPLAIISKKNRRDEPA
ncbi:MAG: hypothetical protein GQ582_12395 [Methyloprofundus sp.]|nr:hypothetical protein [Methyloprofundus sp.]